jgi:hypothetical protein
VLWRYRRAIAFVTLLAAIAGYRAAQLMPPATAGPLPGDVILLCGGLSSHFLQPDLAPVRVDGSGAYAMEVTSAHDILQDDARVGKVQHPASPLVDDVLDPA